MRVVLDTNILVRAGAKARGPARELLERITASQLHTLILSPFLLREAERVFGYDRVRAFSKLTDIEVAEYLNYLRTPGISEIVFPGPAPRVVPSDSDDDSVVHTAIIGQANALCTLNGDFFHPDVLKYCRERDVLVMNDVDLLNILRSLSESTSH